MELYYLLKNWFQQKKIQPQFFINFDYLFIKKNYQFRIFRYDETNHCSILVFNRNKIRFFFLSLLFGTHLVWKKKSEKVTNIKKISQISYLLCINGPTSTYTTYLLILKKSKEHLLKDSSFVIIRIFINSRIKSYLVSTCIIYMYTSSSQSSSKKITAIILSTPVNRLYKY